MLETDAARDTRIARSVRPLRPLVVALVMAALLVSPVSAGDRDGDGLRDAFESRYGATSPDSRDTDGDGVIDSAEDNDRDKLGNLGEQRFGTNPRKRDSDGDGRPDGLEDKDRDGRSNAREQDQRPVPAGLTPSLAKAPRDITAHKSRCQTSHGSADVTRCEFGVLGSGVTVALIGDSHAMMFLPALETIAQERGWRLVTLVKSACPPVLGVHNAAQRWVDGGASCRSWRRSVFGALHGDPPDHVILVHSYSYKLSDASGREIKSGRRPEVWKSGMRRTLTALPRSSRVLLLGDVPRNTGKPVFCLRKNPKDMSACATRRESPAERSVERALRQAAANKGAKFRSLYGKICTYDPCPLVQGDVLMWRDGGHLTSTFVHRLTPALRSLLSSAIAATPARRASTP